MGIQTTRLGFPNRVYETLITPNKHDYDQQSVM